MSDRTYRPCRNGIHVCGIATTDGEEHFITEANVAGVKEMAFDLLENSYALAPDADPDLVVDLMQDGDCLRDFGIRRQSLDALLNSARQLR